MSNSYRKNPFIGNCSHSDKPGKVNANRTLRTHVRQALRTCDDFEALILPLLREVSNVWDFPKDGKHRLNTRGPNFRKWMRK
ncbi:MAG: hypothetical protein BWY75_02962 [bacterium ADurb.Bin425]|jgi:hypothetical protein|nr:MAG: hypothetical protein BWY75_02962 [bacterium ADurb.Bin425]